MASDTSIDHRPGYGELMVNATTLQCASEVDVHQPLSLKGRQKTGKEVVINTGGSTFQNISLVGRFAMICPKMGT